MNIRCVFYCSLKIKNVCWENITRSKIGLDENKKAEADFEKCVIFTN